MYDDLEPSLVKRLQAASYALPVQELLREVADVVSDLDAKGATDSQINLLIHTWMEKNGFGFEAWRAGMEEDFKGVPLFEAFDKQKLWRAYGVEEWLRECIRSIAFTDEPIPFLPFAAGYWINDDTTDPPTLIAVLTPLSDPQLAARQLIEKHRKVFGKTASGSPHSNEVFNAQMLARHRAGMSYTEIAIQNLRSKYPDITANSRKRRPELEREKERVAKAVPAARELWKERGLDSSTPG